jgi:hypothetical protein
MKQCFTKGLLLLLVIRLSTGCASIIHGSTQNVDIASAPDDAEVWVDGARMGKTPTRLTLKRGDSHTIKVQKEGFKETTILIDKQVSAWIIGNVVFGGLIGCGIDFISGGAYDLKPDRVDVNLTKMAQLSGQTLEIHTAQLDKIKEVRFLDDAGRPIIVTSINWVD